MNDGRWPPIYEPAVLETAVTTLAGTAADATRFFGEVSALGGDVCQGDVLSFRSPLPAIDANGDVSADEEVDLWFVVGNSCDYNRSIDEVPWIQVAPIYPLPSMTPPDRLRDLRGYRLSRAFYLPKWPGAPADSVGFFADLTKSTLLHRSLLPSQSAPAAMTPAVKPEARVVARISQDAWFLMQCALVRFLARDDGRFEAK